ncbi:hypothetical protein V6N13_072829 [Hibiscus sabdariffa]|uniref:Uncharacterized protein n=1 Tax=Hibiscus sabdariffa TaxID=183260 RepID=A0ABR2E7A2_9ROSI
MLLDGVIHSSRQTPALILTPYAEDPAQAPGTADVAPIADESILDSSADGPASVPRVSVPSMDSVSPHQEGGDHV